MATYVCKIAAQNSDDGAITQTRLVEAKNQAQALAHVSASHITVEKATSAQLVELGAAGVKIEAVE
jgi:hypothetical protein